MVDEVRSAEIGVVIGVRSDVLSELKNDSGATENGITRRIGGPVKELWSGAALEGCIDVRGILKKFVLPEYSHLGNQPNRVGN